MGGKILFQRRERLTKGATSDEQTVWQQRMIFAGFDFQFPPRRLLSFDTVSTLAIAIVVTVGSIDISMVGGAQCGRNKYCLTSLDASVRAGRHLPCEASCYSPLFI